MKLIGYQLKEGEYRGNAFSGFELYFSFKNESIWLRHYESVHQQKELYDKLRRTSRKRS